MSAILPPSERLWWKHPLDRLELTWIIIAFTWCMVLFFMMVFWHVYGKQNLATETYKTNPALFMTQTQAFVDKYTVRTETEQNIPVVAPPEGADIYLIARLWSWWPILELEKGKTYKLHLTSMDYNHGFSLQPTNMNIQVVPGYEHVIKVTPNESGVFSIVCNEYCGIGHHEMVSRLYVK
uniref:cytochrome C oxidase subunit II n=1 Tax=Castellaniella defragrans TaxID=75697 RepID=UPI00334278D1